MLGYLFVDIIFSQKRTVFRERVYCPTNIFDNTRDLKIGKITQLFPCLAEVYFSHVMRLERV